MVNQTRIWGIAYFGQWLLATYFWNIPTLWLSVKPTGFPHNSCTDWTNITQLQSVVFFQLSIHGTLPLLQPTTNRNGIPDGFVTHSSDSNWNDKVKIVTRSMLLPYTCIYTAVFHQQDKAREHADTLHVLHWCMIYEKSTNSIQPSNYTII